MCSRENEFKSLLFSLVYYIQGWNRPYPFTTGDLTISVNVLYNYLEANAKVCVCTCNNGYVTCIYNSYSAQNRCA